MRNFLDNMRNKLNYWMQGRYGYDELNNTLSVSFLVLWVISLITKSSVFYYMGLIALGYSLYRSLSRDHIKRSNERLWFLKKVDQIKRLPKQWKFYRCKQCGVTIRVPKGKGQIEITCPKCGYKFIERT